MPEMRIIGPSVNARDECEAVLRTLPAWFGIEEALLMYARDSTRLPTFAATDAAGICGFVSLQEHFPQAWEVHCIAIRADARNRGIGKALLMQAEHWLIERGVEVLQVKTIAATKDSPPYAETRAFYARLGFVPLEVFPELWAPHNPCLQLVKFLGWRQRSSADHGSVH